MTHRGPTGPGSLAVRRRQPALGRAGCLAVAALLCLFGATASATAVASPARAGSVYPGMRYVALGDSYSSGEGNPLFLPGTTDKCDRSDAAYGPLLKTFLKITKASDFSFHACSGAIMADLVANLGGHASGQYADGPQLDAIAPAGKPSLSTGLVTLSLGGNDVGFAFALSDCALIDGFANPTANYTCTDSIARYLVPGERLLEHGGRILVTKADNGWSFCDASCAARNAADTSPDKGTQVVTVPSLSGLYMEIHKRAPNARIRVLLYPQVFPLAPTDACDVGYIYGQTVSYGTDDMARLNAAGNELDQLIEAQVSKARAAGIPIAAVDSRPAYAAAPGHGLCGGPSWINGVSFTGWFPPTAVRGSFHPNALGQQAFAAAFEASLG